MDEIKKNILKDIANLEKVPQGAYNIRVNGKLDKRKSTKEINIVPQKEKDGIEIYVKSGVKNQSIHIPVILTKSGLKDIVYNDFYIGDDCDILIIAGCGIHCTGKETSEHSGEHTFHVGKNSKVRYVEKHIAYGDISAKKIMNPNTKIYLEEGSSFIMETHQLNGIDDSDRKTYAEVLKNANLIIKESISTNLKQVCKTDFEVRLKGEKSSCHITSRSFATDNSEQAFTSKLVGEKECFGHVECDAIIDDMAKVTSTPEISAMCSGANLVHEAVIGKLAPEQVVKLMTLGLDEKQAVDTIIQGFLN